MTATPTSSAGPSTPMIIGVLGPIPLAGMGITDAHNHIWIEPVPGAAPDAPVLNQREGILAELADYRASGGSAILDCQPGGCGRNGRVLAELSRASGVALVCATGFHRRRYYPPDYGLWQASPEQAASHFLMELVEGIEETQDLPWPVRAGFIKVACEASLKDTPLNLLEGAAQAAAASRAVIEIHTEKGASAEAILYFMTRRGVPAGQIVLCHMDKRPDVGLHRELVQAGALLEYDTFYRPKYDPEHGLWPLLETMIEAGLAHGIALATDIAEAPLWKHLGNGPGLPGFTGIIRPRLQSLGCASQTVDQLMGGNIALRLAHSG